MLFQFICAHVFSGVHILYEHDFMDFLNSF